MAKRGALPEPSRTARSTLALGTPDNDAARPCTSSSPGKRERRRRDTGVPGCCQRVPPRAGSSLAVHSGRLTAARSHLRSTITTHARAPVLTARVTGGLCAASASASAPPRCKSLGRRVRARGGARRTRGRPHYPRASSRILGDVRDVVPVRFLGLICACGRPLRSAGGRCGGVRAVAMRDRRGEPGLGEISMSICPRSKDVDAEAVRVRISRPWDRVCREIDSQDSLVLG